VVAGQAIFNRFLFLFEEEHALSFSFFFFFFSNCLDNNFKNDLRNFTFHSLSLSTLYSDSRLYSIQFMRKKKSCGMESYYRLQAIRLLKFSSLMLFGVLFGLASREMGRLLPRGALSSEGDRFAYMSSLNFLHGHWLLVGSVLPALMALMLYASAQLGAKPIRERSLKISVSMTVYGALLSLSLHTYKAFAQLIIAKRELAIDATLDAVALLDAVDARIFFGHKLARIAIYAVSHLLLTSGLMMFGSSLYRSLSNAAVESKPRQD
jgi:hypothetical protein